MSVTEVEAGRRDTVVAWLSLLGFVVSFFAAFFVGEGLSSAFGYDVGSEGPAPPVWVMLASTIPALIVFAIPGVVAWIFGRRAVRHGDQRGNVPAIIGLVIAGAFALMNAMAPFVPGM